MTIPVSPSATERRANSREGTSGSRGPAPAAGHRLPVVVVAGAGMMGRQIAAEFALHACRVIVLAREPVRARDDVQKTLDWGIRRGIATSASAVMATANLTYDVTDGSACGPVDLLLDCLPEDWQTKVDVLSSIAARVRPAVVGTNTSSFSITRLGSAIGQQKRVVGIHYWNPPLLMPLVEVTGGDGTSAWTSRLARQLVLRCGKTPVAVNHDVPGFLWNRLQMAILREALWLVRTGVATVEDIDTVTQVGLARRWRYAGLFASVYLGNPRQWEAIAATLFPQLSDAIDAEGLAELVAEVAGPWADLGERRDAGLASDTDADAGTHDERLGPT